MPTVEPKPPIADPASRAPRTPSEPSGSVHAASNHPPPADGWPAPRRSESTPASRFVPLKDGVAAGRPHFRWLDRPRRVLMTLTAVWVLGIFDLGFTLSESKHGRFVEMNPLANRLLAQPVYAIIGFKLSLVALGSGILLALRRHAIAELGCWFLFAANSYVAIRWCLYYESTLSGAGNVFINAPL